MPPTTAMTRMSKTLGRPIVPGETCAFCQTRRMPPSDAKRLAKV